MFENNLRLKNRFGASVRQQIKRISEFFYLETGSWYLYELESKSLELLLV